MKITKGCAGYVDKRKKQLITMAVIEFGIVIAIFILGYVQTKTRLNLLTVVAILGCLPASKALVGVITIFPYKSVPNKVRREIDVKGHLLTPVFDTVITSYEKVLPVDCFVISDNIVCGYTHHKKVDAEYAARHIKVMLEQNGYQKVTVKIFQDYTKFIARVEGLNSMRKVDHEQNQRKEEGIKRVLLNISM